MRAWPCNQARCPGALLLSLAFDCSYESIVALVWRFLISTSSFALFSSAWAFFDAAWALFMALDALWSFFTAFC